MEAGLLVVKRYRLGEPDPVSQGALSRPPRIGGDVAEVFRAYRGFEGVPWPEVPAGVALVRGLADLEQLSPLVDFVNSRLPADQHDLLYCEKIADASSRNTPAGFVDIGFDVGVYESENDSYSAILHELVFGKYDALVAFGPALNSSLLFASRLRAEEFRQRRSDLLAQGFDLEGDEARVFLVARTATTAPLRGRDSLPDMRRV
jgi:hypothetical protein